MKLDVSQLMWFVYKEDCPSAKNGKCISNRYAHLLILIIFTFQKPIYILQYFQLLRTKKGEEKITLIFTNVIVAYSAQLMQLGYYLSFVQMEVYLL